MDTLTTRGIAIRVDTEYWAPYSQPDRDHYVFAYRIEIENLGLDAVQLQRRCWRVTNATGDVRMVEGPGVVGETPILGAGERYSYTSWCQLRSPLGAMEGFYTMVSEGGDEFPVFVPKFVLTAPWQLN